MLVEHGDWIPLGSAGEQKPTKDGTVEAWGRSESNPVGGWYGLKQGYRGRFGMYIPPLMEELGLARWNTTRATTGSGWSERAGARRHCQFGFSVQVGLGDLRFCLHAPHGMRRSPSPRCSCWTGSSSGLQTVRLGCVLR